MIAIEAALKRIEQMLDTQMIPEDAKINIFTDSKSSIDKLQSRMKSNENLVVNVKGILNKLCKGGMNITFQWLPSHCGVDGNERVDGVAKQASALIQLDGKIDFNSAKATIKRMCMKKWSDKCKAKTDAVHVPAELEKELSHQEKTLLSQLRTGGHTTKLAWYRNWISRDDPVPESPACPRCLNEDETVEHIFCRCPMLQTARKKWLNSNRMETIFRNPANAAKFLRDAGVVDASHV